MFRVDVSSVSETQSINNSFRTMARSVTESHTILKSPRDKIYE